MRSPAVSAATERSLRRTERGVAMLPMLVLMAFPLLGIVLFFVLPPGLAVPLYVLGLGLSILVNWLMVRAMRSPVQTGRRGMVGAPARALSWGDESGYVSCHGEVWRARSVDGSPLTPGTLLEVTGVEAGEDMVLQVRAIREGEAASRPG